MRIAVLGSGSWGSALAIHFGRSGFDVVQWCREREVAESINDKRENLVFLKGVTYPETVRATSSIEEVFSQPIEIVLSVIPVQLQGSSGRKSRNLLETRRLSVPVKVLR